MTDENEQNEEIARLRAEVDALKQGAAAQPAPPPPTPATPTYVVQPKKSGGFGRGCLIVLAAIGGLFVFLIVVGAMVGSHSSSSTSAPAAGQAPASYKVGDSIGVGDLKVKVTAVDVGESFGSTFDAKASEGGVLVVVKYALTNDTDKPVSAGEAPKFHLVDPKGTVYDEDSGKTSSLELDTSTDQKAWSDINPGITTRGVSVFEVSKSTFAPANWAVVVGDNDGPQVSIPSGG